MRISRFVLLAVCLALLPLSSSAQLRPNENGQGWEWHYDGMANNPGLCVME